MRQGQVKRSDVERMTNDYLAKSQLSLYLMQHSNDEKIKELYDSLDSGDLDDTIRLYTTYGWDTPKMVEAFLSQDDDAQDDNVVPDEADEPEQRSSRRKSKPARKNSSKPSKKPRK